MKTPTTTLTSNQGLCTTKQFLCSLLCLTATHWATQTHAQALSPAIPGEYIVVLKPGARGEEVSQEHGVAARHQYKHALNGFAGHIPEGRLNALQNDPRVEFIEQDIAVQAFSQTIPSGIRRIGADVSPAAKIDGIDERVNADIAIIDTGIDLTHPDLNVYRNVTFVSGTTSGNDDYGHGTHVAGIAAALDNGIGVVGVAPGARLWAVKVLDSTGSGAMSQVVQGIDYVTQHASEIEVANMSLGAYYPQTDSLRLAIQNSVAKGVVYVVAAGNSRVELFAEDYVLGGWDIIPAAYPEVMTVSALVDTDGKSGGVGSSTSYGADDTLATFSNYSVHLAPGNPVNSPGLMIDVAAPGVNIYSTYIGGGYATMSGTSMASPHVAGAVALYISQYGRAYDAAGVYAIRQALVDAAAPQNTWGANPTNPNAGDVYAEGLINVAKIGSNVTPPPDTTPPTCAIASPSGGVTVSGTITVSVNASDNVGVSSVQLYVDGVPGSTDSSSPYSIAWSTTTASNGSHLLMAKAYDAAGNISSSASITVNVQNAVTDTTSPVCSITSPTAGALVSGTITPAASASDNVGVARVEFYVDTVLRATDTVSPYSFSWDTTTVANGNHTLVSKAFDAAGNAGTSSAVTVSVQNAVSDATAPSCTIASPTSGASVSGTVSFNVNAADNVAVSKVEFYIDGALRSTDTTSPYSFSWDTTTSANGGHTLLAKAYDAAGNSTTSASVSVTVQNSGSDSVPPTAIITSPTTGSHVSGNLTVSISATDNVKVTRVDLYVDGSVYASSTSATPSFNWSAAKAGKGTHTLTARAVDAAGNVGTSSSVTVYK